MLYDIFSVYSMARNWDAPAEVEEIDKDIPAMQEPQPTASTFFCVTALSKEEVPRWKIFCAQRLQAFSSRFVVFRLYVVRVIKDISSSALLLLEPFFFLQCLYYAKLMNI